MNVLVLVGSTRPDSFNAQLAAAAVAALPEGTTVERFDRLNELPFYSDEGDANPPAVVADLRAAVGRAEALVVVTPEFNASVPAALKNAIDWASRPYDDSSINGKPAAVLAATPTPGDAGSARDHLVAILRRARALPLETTVGVSAAHEAFVSGELTDPTHATAVEALIANLVSEGVPA
ncbi:NADPH-dependent FMN reductase [Pseudactinotalea sp.]|uniref:NADPH-dependent FMN reductase n=1 Tax=Pseudactinotalea sp. TaxID=1926260 RepID=UPI003B3B9C52